jgi:hypothetical protein
VTRFCDTCHRRIRLAWAWVAILSGGRACSWHCFRRMAEGES